MRAVTVIPGQTGSAALTDMPEPPPDDGPVLVQTQAVGICGTDLEIINGDYGWAPPDQDRLIIGHESLGRVAEAAPGTGFGPGDLVVGIVRLASPSPARPARRVTGTCAPTAGIPSGGSRPGTAMPPSDTASTPNTWSRWTPPWGLWACC